ncbi:MAG: protease family protein [Solirubrobacteraceae bacterium]|jgi:membrane protease YdiL (CAAX protease family)|nr:protease family protein [Solirubrobacteraceae bacterium]
MSRIPPPLAYPHPGPPPELPELPDGVSPQPRWPAWTAPVALIAGFSGALFGAIVIGIVASATGSSIEHPPPAAQITATAFQDMALIGSALVFARLSGRPRPWQFGLRPTRFWPALGWTALTWFGFLLFSAVWVSALAIKERDRLPDELGASSSSVALISVAVLVCVLAPVAEEFFFRGFFFNALRAWKGPLLAAILTGLVFGGIHAGSAPAPFLVPLAMFGFGLCLLYWRTGSLYPCIVLHSLNNSLAFGVSQHWGWQIPVLMLGANALIAAVILPLGGVRRGQPAPA